MAKKAIANLIVGDRQFEKGKIYTEEQVKDVDATNFVDATEEEIASSEVLKEEVKESVQPELDTQPVDEKKEESSVLGEEINNASPIEETDTRSDFEKGL